MNLREEITITKEIYDVIKLLKENHIKSLCISDKPDETIIPNQELMEKGFSDSLYLIKAKVYGKDIYEQINQILQHK